MTSVDDIFDQLASKKVGRDGYKYEILLRSKESFTSQFSEQLLIESYFKDRFNKYKFISRIIIKFKQWVASLFGLQGVENVEDSDYIFDEDFELDNILLS